MYDTPYWNQRWGRTAGYTLFQERFSVGDLINARLRYRRPMDDRLEGRMKQIISSTFPRHLLWAGIAAPKEAFWEGNWKDYTPQGRTLYESALMNLLVARRPPNEYLSVDELKTAKVRATEILTKMGYNSTQDRKPDVTPIPKEIVKEVEYELRKTPEAGEVFGDWKKED